MVDWESSDKTTRRGFARNSGKSELSLADVFFGYDSVLQLGALLAVARVPSTTEGLVGP